MLTFQILICACASMWHVTFNPFKSKSLILSRKVNKPYHPPIYMNFQQVNSHKNLGIYLSRDCTWHEHIKHIMAKAWQRIHIMRRLKFILDRKSLQTIYFAFIRPILDMLMFLGSIAQSMNPKELEKIKMKLLVL